MTENQPIIVLKELKINLGGTEIHKGINLTINRGEIVGIVGGSGSARRQLLREMLMLQPPDSGEVKIFNQDLMRISAKNY